MADRMSVKVFWEAVEARLAARSVEELRAILRGMASRVKSAERRAFLGKLDPTTDSENSVLPNISEESLIADIDDLVREIGLEMENADEWDENHGWDDYYDDEDSLGPYEEFVEQVENLFDRVQAAFDAGDFSLARKAYEKLFEEIFFLEDDYGRGIQTTDLSIDMVEIRGRYLRSVYETEPLATRPEELYDHLLETQSFTSHQAPPMLDELLQCTPQPLSERELFFVAWIDYLKRLEGVAADAWLREAVRIFEGTQGLERLARSRGLEYPRTYLDWFAALQQEGKFAEILDESQAALAGLQDMLPIRAAIAEYLCIAALEQGKPEVLRAGRWQAFLAKPDLARLLDLWEGSEPDDSRIIAVGRAARYLANYLENPPDRRAVVSSWEGDGLESPAWTDRSVLTHAYLLAHDFDRAHALATDAEVLGWSNADNAQSIVVPYFLVYLSGKLSDGPTPNLGSLWESALSPDWRYEPNWDEPDPRRAQLEKAYVWSIQQASIDPKREMELLSWCLQVSMERATAIVSNQYRKSYHKAARVIVACAEVLRLRGRSADAEKYIGEIGDRFPRHRAFQRELKNATRLR